MATADYRVTVVFDYTATWDDDDQEVDEDYLHDAIMDSYDTVDLEVDTEHPKYDKSGDEIEGETFTVNLNADNIRDVVVEKA
jgi:hypothetical protein